MAHTQAKHQTHISPAVNQRGAALVELIIAVLVVGLVLTALATSLTYSIMVTSAARKQDVASSVAQDVIETFHKERALAGWNTFYAHFSSHQGLTCIDQSTSKQLDNTGKYENRDLNDLFPRINNKEHMLQLPDCRREVDGVGTPFYQYIDVSATADSIVVSVDVYWDMSSTLEKSLAVPVVKIFRKTD